MKTAVVLTIAVLANSVGNLLLSIGMQGFETPEGSGTLWIARAAQHVVTNPWMIAGVLALIVFLSAYLTALSWADLSYVIPATALGYVVIALLSEWLLGETVTLTRWAGILLVGGGVYLLARGPVLTVPAKPEEPAAALEGES